MKDNKDTNTTMVNAPTFPVPEGCYPCIVCTDRQVVAFGYTDKPAEAIVKEGIVTLYNARNAFRWGTTMGLYELCVNGPGREAKIGSTVPSVTLSGVHAVLAVTDTAVKAWMEAVWAR